MDNSEAEQHGSASKSTSWTAKLSQKLKRRSHGSDRDGGTTSRGTSSEYSRPSTTSQNPFARNYVPPEEAHHGSNRDASIEQQRSPQGHNVNRPTTAGSGVGQSPTSRRGDANAAGYEEDDIIGLDMNGKARRRSDATRNPIKKDKTASSSNPFARDYVPPSSPTTAGGTTSDGTSHVRRKEVPNAQAGGLSSNSANHGYSDAAQSGTTGGTLPIFSQFSSKTNPSEQSSSRDPTTTVQKAKALLGKDSTRHQDHDVDGLETGIRDMNLDRSKHSDLDRNHRTTETKGHQTHNALKEGDHPSAQEIIARVGHNTTDTTVHERMAPAVTHEVIQKQVHEIVQEHVTRDVHHYHHVHRILPVHEVEVLPPKHYRIVDGVQVEIPADQIPQSRINAMQTFNNERFDGATPRKR